MTEASHSDIASLRQPTLDVGRPVEPGNPPYASSDPPVGRSCVQRSACGAGRGVRRRKASRPSLSTASSDCDTPTTILVDTLNPPRTYAVEASQLMAVHKILGLAGETFKLSPAGLRRLTAEQKAARAADRVQS